jgi:hypothetical protein
VEEDWMIITFLGAGVLVLALIVFFGVRSSIRKARTGTISWQSGFRWLGDQTFVESSAVELGDKRQWELFRAVYQIGSRIDAVPVPVGPDEAPAFASFTVSRVSQSLGAGWPKAKLGFTAYFKEFEGVEFPARYAVKADRRISSLSFDAAGVVGHDSAGEQACSASWEQLRFSNGSDLILTDGSTMIHVEFPKDKDERDSLEELVIKYGTLKQMHF